jgi:hypothetical protein
MDRKEFDALEIEANAELPRHLANFQAAQHKARVRAIVEKEQLSELEPGQAPIYTQYISPQEVLHNF